MYQTLAISSGFVPIKHEIHKVFTAVMFLSSPFDWTFHAQSGSDETVSSYLFFHS